MIIISLGKNEGARKPLKIKASGHFFFLFILAFILAAADQLLPSAGGCTMKHHDVPN